MDESSFGLLEHSLKQFIAGTHEEGVAVGGPQDRSLLTNHLEWNFDVAWAIDTVNQDAEDNEKSRTQQAVDVFGDQYVVICSNEFDDVDSKFEAFEFAEGCPLRASVERVRRIGLRAVSGRWNVEGRPLGIVMDIHSGMWAYDRYKQELEAYNQIYVPDDSQSRDVLLYGYMVSQFLADFKFELNFDTRKEYRQSDIVIYFHQWTTLIGLVFLQSWENAMQSTTVFYSHDVLLPKMELRCFTKLREKIEEEELMQEGILALVFQLIERVNTLEDNHNEIYKTLKASGMLKSKDQ